MTLWFIAAFLTIDGQEQPRLEHMLMTKTYLTEAACISDGLEASRHLAAIQGLHGKWVCMFHGETEATMKARRQFKGGF